MKFTLDMVSQFLSAVIWEQKNQNKTQKIHNIEKKQEELEDS